MFSLLDKVLKKLPFDGWKSEIGLILAVLPELVVPGQTLVTQLGQVLVTVGILHKAIKKSIRK